MAQRTCTSRSHDFRLALAPWVILFVIGTMPARGAGREPSGATGYAATPSTPSCIGDCNDDRSVTVDEILRMVNIALGNAGISTCPAGDPNDDHQITVDEILRAVNAALSGCQGVGAPTPSPTPAATPSDQELSGTVTYTGSRVQISDSAPIILFLLAFDPDVRLVDNAYIPVNGGPFVLHAPAAGNYYLLYSIDVHNYRDESLSVGAPFEIYNNRYAGSYPSPPPADPVAVPQTGLNLDFGDTGLIPGIGGTVAYTGNRSCGCIDVQASTDPSFSGAPDRNWHCVEPGAGGEPAVNGRYELVFLNPGQTYYLRAFVDVNDNRQLDPGEPFGIAGDNPVVAGATQTASDFTFGDPVAAGPQGLRVFVAPGSTGHASVYGGPIPTGNVADAPESHGYRLLGTFGVGSSGPYDFYGSYPYFLIKVRSGVIPLGSPSVNIDALQNIETSMFLSGMTCRGETFYGSNSSSMDKIYGPPDGIYSSLDGYLLYPVIDWYAYSLPGVR